MKKETSMFLRQFLTSYSDDRLELLIETTERALQGGIKCVQFCWHSDCQEAEVIGLKVKALVSSYGGVLVVNNFPRLASALKADGLHIGQNDCSIEYARSVVGDDVVIGLTVNSISEMSGLADYYGFGPVFRSRTKPVKVLGIQQLKKVCSVADKPVVAIGGITSGNMKDVFNAGACGIAFIGAIYDAEDKLQEARKLCSTY